MQLNTKKYDAFCSHIFDYACLRRKGSLSMRFEITEKLYAFTEKLQKTFLKMAGGRLHTSHTSSTPLDAPLAISYRNHQKNLAYFSHLAPLALFFFVKRQNKNETMPPP